MKKVNRYGVYCHETNRKYQSFRRSSFFGTLREARSYFRICKEYYKCMEQNYDLDHVIVCLSKEYNEDDYIQIDSFYRAF